MRNAFAGARPDYYDRNPLFVGNAFSAGGIAPHALTSRWSYTVPASRKAIYHGGSFSWIRVTAAAPVGNITIRNICNSPSHILWNESQNNTVGGGVNTTVVPQNVLLAGAAISVSTVDASTGGTVDYRLFGNLTEFDA